MTNLSMARRFLILVISLCVIAGISYPLQVYHPALKNIVLWSGFATLIAGELELILSIYLFSTTAKKLAKQVLLMSIILLVYGTTIMIYYFFTNDFNRMGG